LKNKTNETGIQIANCGIRKEISTLSSDEIFRLRNAMAAIQALPQTNVGSYQ
jgi:hypothetical protein